MLDLADFLHSMSQGRWISSRVNELFMDQGREQAIEFSPVGVDCVMSSGFSKDDAYIVFVVDIHC